MTASALPGDLSTPFGILSPYCGSAVGPADLTGRWNLDPVLIVFLAALICLYAVMSGGEAARPPAWRRLGFHAGWLTAVTALLSPLCALSVSLFSARVGQHMLLTLVAAPLIALGRPDLVAGRWLAPFRSRPASDSGAAPGPVLAALSFAAALWLWHTPRAYAATFESDLAYWAMHLSLFGSALWLWTALLNPRRLPASLAAVFLTTGQMGLLGAIITFSAQPIYWPHAYTTAAWGLTPLADQQLGGVIMWVPAGVLFIIGLAAAFAEAMRRSETPSASELLPDRAL